MIIKNTRKMEKAVVKNSSLHKKNSEEDVGRNPSSVSVENVEKLTIRTKNGLVNGVAEEKCKTNKKQINAKPNVGTNILKEPKKSKKGHSSGVQNNEINVSNSSISKKNSQKSKKIEPSNTKNCVTNTETGISVESKVPASSLAINDNCSTKEDLNSEINQLKPNQSESKANEPPSNKTESKRKKSKSKSNKTEPTMQIEQNDFDLPKFDITSIINATFNNENLLSKVSEAPSSSQLDTNKSYLLEYQDSSSEFEKDLIESIKNLKIQQQESGLKETPNSDNLLEAKTEAEETALMQQEENLCDITYVQYESELQMPMIMRIIQKDLSEPYSIYTYRYFIHNWPKLCFLAMCEEKCVGAIVCKLDFHRKSTKRGYIAMLAVDKDYRNRRIGSTLVRRAITEMIAGGADEVVLETEVTNKPALRLYEQLGFVRDKRLFRYYLNGVDALRLKLWLR